MLVPIIERQAGLHVVFTLRSSHLPAHAGQVSFPGGRAEASDADAVATALRETEEEVGLARTFVASSMSQWHGFESTEPAHEEMHIL